MTTFMLLVLISGCGIGLTAGLGMWWLVGRDTKTQTNIDRGAIVDRVRAVGKLVGLEVRAKEIATATKGLPWMPPALLSQARLAMIFQFERQYHVDLQRIVPECVTRGPGGIYRIVLPPVEGSLHLTDVTPYDIQDGRVLGLLDVIPMNAKAQGDLMKRAQEQASSLFEDADAKYLDEAKRSIRERVESLLAYADIEAKVLFEDDLHAIPFGMKTPKLEEPTQPQRENILAPQVAVALPA